MLKNLNKQNKTVTDAINAVDRNQFISMEHGTFVVGHSIPAQSIVKQILSLLDIPPGGKLLHIGAGSGYLTAILAHIAEQVIAIESTPSLVKKAEANFKQQGLDNVIVKAGDGSNGAPDSAPYDAIIISSPSIKEKAPILKQLSASGLLACLELDDECQQMLVKYTRKGQLGFNRQELGLINFNRDKADIFIELDIASNELLDKAKANAKISGNLMIDELRRLIDIDDIELYRSLASQYNLNLGNPDLLLATADPNLFDAFSRAFLDYNRLIPIKADDNKLTIATYNPDVPVKEVQQMYPELHIEKILVTPTDFKRLWSSLELCLQGKKEQTVPEFLEAEAEHDILEIIPPDFEAQMVSIYDALLLDAIAERASDIHIEQYNNMVRIRLRIDGELRDQNHYDLTIKDLKSLINVIKLRSELNIAERRLPQGGRSRLCIGTAFYDLRVQVQPSLHGEHVIIRILPQSNSIVGIESLGLSPRVANNYKRLLDNPSGLVLVVGPTGSGKSTTLYAGLQLLANDGKRKVITVEDPIEYSINNIQQTRVRPDIGFNFADAMRSFVRQDPDVILVGEIRDQETALEAIRASQTGHVVLSTLHCNDAVDAVQRIYDLGIHPNSLASELLAVIAQRLAKRICPDCREEVEPEPDILAELFPDGAPKSFRCYKGKGCVHCNGLGTKGRVAVVEYMHANKDIRNAISAHPPIGELRSLALDTGLITMRDSALDHVIAGTIPLSELPRILPEERMAPEARGYTAQ